MTHLKTLCIYTVQVSQWLAVLSSLAQLNLITRTTCILVSNNTFKQKRLGLYYNVSAHKHMHMQIDFVAFFEHMHLDYGRNPIKLMRLHVQS